MFRLYFLLLSYFVFQYFTIKRHVMKVILEKCSTYKIKYLRIY
jgi:hypothetical protein